MIVLWYASPLTKDSGLYFSFFEYIQCDAPKSWKSYFCCHQIDNGINKQNIKVINLDGASNGFTRSPQLPRDTSNNTLGSIAVSVASRIVTFIYRG
jgi:hypothetical protein